MAEGSETDGAVELAADEALEEKLTDPKRKPNSLSDNWLQYDRVAADMALFCVVPFCI
jgi:hypothetical protein